ncbi:iron-siderophore ABC transporter substrate-binding protein [Mumia zhuanghuii]|uniref:iron-siderophore ABC transporter substrate-binding protein n=1 Tax=Mumia zhuanghuii TaxID=2585211 RepID=UPI00362BE687
MKPTRTLLVASAAALALALSACGTTEDDADNSSSDSNEKITITDARGEKVTLDGPAEKVASTEWNTVEYLISLGIQPTAVSDIKGFKAWDQSVELDDSATDIGTRGEPSIDTLAGLGLDVVFVTDTLAGDAIKQIEETTPVIVMPGGDSSDPFGQMWKNVDLVAQATGTEDEAADLKKDFDDKIAEAKETIAATDAAGAPVAFNDAWEQGGAVSVRPYLEGSQIGAVLKELGFEDAWTSVEGVEGDAVYGLGTTDIEGLTKLPADTLYWYIANDTDVDVYAGSLKDNKVWNSLPFVKAGNVERFPDGIWMFGGPASMLDFTDAVVKTVS